MNKILQKLLDSGDILSRRSLRFFIENTTVAYTTEYYMDGALGPFKWYVTWKSDECNEPNLLMHASIYIHDARTRLYFPAYLDCRIPPENNVDIKFILARYHIPEYDKFDLIMAEKGWTPVHAGMIEEIEAVDCPLDEIHAIEEIWDEYKRTLYNTES